MEAHLKKIWKLTLCNGLFIHLIGCNQVSMHIGEYSDSGGIPIQSNQVSTANAMPTGDAFNHIDPNNTPISELIACIHLGMHYVNELVQVHPAFTKKIISEQTLSDLCKSKVCVQHTGRKRVFSSFLLKPGTKIDRFR